LQLQGIANNSQDFIPRLKNHLLACYNDIPYDGDEHAFSDKEQDSISFVSNHMYEHGVLQVNYTTYIRRQSTQATLPDHAHMD
jgi:hypothetical protein